MKSILHGILAAMLGGCGYTSQYTPPSDGRARPLWVDDHVVDDMPARAEYPACREALYWTAHPEQPVAVDEQAAIWIPPPLPPAAIAARVIVPPSARTIVEFPTPKNPRELGLPLVAVFSVFLPPVWAAVALGLAADRPEAGAFSSESIDEVNAYNDLARRGGNPCAP